MFKPPSNKVVIVGATNGHKTTNHPSVTAAMIKKKKKGVCVTDKRGQEASSVT